MNDLNELMEADADAAPVVTDEALAGIANLAQQQVALEKEVAETKAKLDTKQKELRNMSEVKLPGAMQALGLKAFTTDDGYAITIKDDVFASISKKNTEAAHKWLREYGFDDIIKNEVISSFGRGDDHLAAEVIDRLQAMGVEIKHKEAVHSGTLRAFIKEQLAMGNAIPLDIFGAHLFKKTTITR